MSRARVPGALVAACLATALLAGPTRGEGEEDLEVLRRAIEERRERVTAYEREARGLFQTIQAVDDAIRTARDEVDRIAAQAQEASQRLAELEAESAGLETRVARTREQLSARVVALYKEGALGPVRLVFADGTLRDRLGRIQAIQRMADHDARLLERLRQEETALARAREDALGAAERHEQARQALRSRTAALAAERGARRDLLERVRRDRARERALLVELEATARALEETLARVRSVPEVQPPGTPLAGFEGRQGQLPAPVSGPVRRRFGRVVDAEFRTKTFRKGVDFAVMPGEPVHAVAAGQVRFAGWLGGYGRMVILDHGEDYFTVSGHLDSTRVEVGQRLEAGEQMGEAGETGSLSGPRLYFEIRKGGDALDPAEWLVGHRGR